MWTNSFIKLLAVWYFFLLNFQECIISSKPATHGILKSSRTLACKGGLMSPTASMRSSKPGRCKKTNLCPAGYQEATHPCICIYIIHIDICLYFIMSQVMQSATSTVTCFNRQTIPWICKNLRYVSIGRLYLEGYNHLSKLWVPQI